MYLKRCALPFLCAVCFIASPAFAQVKLHAPDTNKSINELSWLAGRWRSKDENPAFEEHWMSPQDGSMIGMGRELSGGKVEFFEFLRIEQRKDGLFYVAQPRGKAQTDFKLTNENENTLMFENPEHDFPNVIEYEKRKDGSLCVRVSGNGKKKNKAFARVLYRF
jgi:hypothetical protein